MNIFIELFIICEKINKIFTDESKIEFVNCDFNNLNVYHFSLGTYIRNTILLDNYIIVKKFNAIGITHKDDMSSFIIMLLYIYLKD